MLIFFQIGSGLHGSTPESYVKYDSSLIPRCIYALTADCKFTIAFWAKNPVEAHATLLSTFNVSNDRNTGVEIGVGHHNNPFPVIDGIRIGATITTNASAVPAQITISSGRLDPDVWHHIALTYRNRTHSALYVDFVNAIDRFTVDTAGGFRPLRTEVYMATGFRIPPGHSGGSGRTRFGILDELVVFPEYLSADQIMQLQNSA